MKTLVAILAFLAISSLAFAQEQQYDAQEAVVTPEWFFPHPIFMPHPMPFHRFPFHPMPFRHLPFPHYIPSLPPMSAPNMPSSPPAPKGPCEDDIRSFFSTHTFAPSSTCCAALTGIPNPHVQALVTRFCSAASPPSS